MATRVVPVTSERLSASMSYQQFLEAAKPEHRVKYEAREAETRVTEAQAAPFRAISKKADGPVQVVVLGEDWCPDVQRTLPAVKKLAEQVGWKLHVFSSDVNKDIIEQFPNKDGGFAIPTVVFLDKKGGLLGAWIERPQIGYAEMREFTSRTPAPEKEETRAFFKARQPAWQDASIEEWKVLLKA